MAVEDLQFYACKQLSSFNIENSDMENGLFFKSKIQKTLFEIHQNNMPWGWITSLIKTILDSFSFQNVLRLFK